MLSNLPSPSRSLEELDGIPILLVTPSFAQWVDTTSHHFLEDWITKLSGGSATKPTHAIVAIVDRLPDTRAQSGGEDLTESEGMSFIVVQSEGVQGTVAAPRRIRSMEAEESALTVSFRDGKSNGKGPRRIHEIGLRLANTIFINGNENTLFGTRWVYDSASSRYTVDQSVNLSRCIIGSDVNAVKDTLQLPLHPVSQRRRVISSMGNILRQVAKHADDRSTAPMPASSELEKELPRYIAQNDIMDQRVSVWALVETPEQSSATKPLENSLLPRVRAGGKLHRVMSGGGGWGKKQGLLSLDPEIRVLGAAESLECLPLDHLYSPIETDHTQLHQPFPEQRVDDLTSLSQVAREGDYIQFFVSVDPSGTESVQPDTAGAQDAVVCRFGVVADAEVPMMFSSATTSDKDLMGAPNYFGALSEKAITYLHPVVPTASKEEVVESSTKLDIPGCRLALAVQ